MTGFHARLENLLRIKKLLTCCFFQFILWLFLEEAFAHVSFLFSWMYVSISMSFAIT
ncbi:hypothetical protein BJX96DRAFT_14778 [Aspergillus floccosus]